MLGGSPQEVNNLRGGVDGVSENIVEVIANVVIRLGVGRAEQPDTVQVPTRQEPGRCCLDHTRVLVRQQPLDDGFDFLIELGRQLGRSGGTV